MKNTSISVQNIGKTFKNFIRFLLFLFRPGKKINMIKDFKEFQVKPHEY